MGHFLLTDYNFDFFHPVDDCYHKFTQFYSKLDFQNSALSIWEQCTDSWLKPPIFPFDLHLDIEDTILNVLYSNPIILKGCILVRYDLVEVLVFG